jgi:hypothetical protein
MTQYEIIIRIAIIWRIAKFLTGWICPLKYFRVFRN